MSNTRLSHPFPDPSLRTPQAMLETLHMAYKMVLDQYDADCGKPTSRLSREEAYDLGRRLGEYWEIKEIPHS